MGDLPEEREVYCGMVEGNVTCDLDRFSYSRAVYHCRNVGKDGRCKDLGSRCCGDFLAASPEHPFKSRSVVSEGLTF